MTIIHVNTAYRISENAINLVENALDNPNLVQVSVASDCVIVVRPKTEGYDAGGIERLPNGESPRWKVSGVNTRLNNADANFIYIRLERETNDALLVFDTKNRNIDGSIIVEGEITGDNSAPDPTYYYMKVGQITATDSVSSPTVKRSITFDFGYYQTDGFTDDTISDLLDRLKDKLDKVVWDRNWVEKKDPNGLDYLFTTKPIVTAAGVTMYSGDTPHLPSMFEGIPLDGETLAWVNGKITVIGGTGQGGITGINVTGSGNAVTGASLSADGLTITLTKGSEFALKSDIPSLSGYATQSWVSSQLGNYATSSSLKTVSDKLNNFLEGTDTDGIINKWKELENFLAGQTQTSTLAQLLSGKADKASTLAGYGITDAYTKNEINTVLGDYVTKAGTQDITGIKSFVNGLKVGGILVKQHADGVVEIDGDLVVTGGVTMYGIGNHTASTILDALPIDSATLSKEGGKLSVIGGTGASTGSITLNGHIYEPDSEGNITLPSYPTTLPASDVYEWAKASTKPSYTYDEISGAPKSLKNPYSLTIQRQGTSLGSYDGSSAKTFNITAPTWEEVTDKPTWIGSSKPTYDFTELTSHPTTISGYGITDAYTKNEINTTLGNYVTKSGAQDITGVKSFINGLKIGNILVKKHADGIVEIDGDLIVTGGVTMYAQGSRTASTILDALPIDADTLSKEGGVLSVIGGGGGSVDGIILNGTTYSPNADTKLITLPNYPTIPSALKNPYSLTIQRHGVSLGTYDGSSAKTFNIASPTWGDVTGKPSWIGSSKPSYTFSEITGKPTTLAGYGITDAPTKTGSGASGTWGISITGNAATATKWATVRNFYVADKDSYYTGAATAVDGTTNVTLHLPGTIYAPTSFTAQNRHFNECLAVYNNAASTATGTICITLPNSFVSSMNIYEIYLYQYDSNAASVITIGAYNYGDGNAWIDSGYQTRGSFDKKVRLGHNGSKCVILLGETTTKWSYPQVYLKSVFTGFNNHDKWAAGYSISLITSESGYTFMTPARATEYFGNVKGKGFYKDGSSDSYVLLGGGGHKALSTITSEYDARYYTKAQSDQNYVSSLRSSPDLIYYHRGGTETPVSISVSNAPKWSTARTLSLTGAVSGSVSMDGSANVSLSTAFNYGTLDGRYYTENEADSRFVNVSGDTMTGKLTVNDKVIVHASVYGGTPSISLAIGDSDSGFNSASDGQLQIYANSTVIANWDSSGFDFSLTPTVNGNTIWHAGNDGAGSGLDADKLDGLQPSDLSVYSATKLQTARSIWGQSFDGTGNVSGWLSGASTIECNVGVKSRNICIETENDGDAGNRSSEINNWNEPLFLQHASAKNLIMCVGGGNVGIGTASPAFKLHVSGTVYATEYCRANSGFCIQGQDIYYSHVNSYASISSAGNEICIDGANDNSLWVNYRKSASGFAPQDWYWGTGNRSDYYANFYLGNITSYGTIEVSGKIKVGSTTGNEKVQIQGWVGTEGATGWYNSTYGGGIHMADNTYVKVYNKDWFRSNMFSAGINGNSDDSYSAAYNACAPNNNNYCCYSFIRAGVYAFGMGFNTSNEIWLGTASSGSRLASSQWLRIGASTMTYTGNILATGGVTMYGSDETKKDIISQIFIPLDYIAHAPLWRYRWKDFRNDRVNVGGSAQYTQMMLGELVGESDKGLVMDYATTAYAFSVCTARHFRDFLDNEFRKHETEIDKLKKENEKMKRRIEELERRARNGCI